MHLSGSTGAETRPWPCGWSEGTCFLAAAGGGCTAEERESLTGWWWMQMVVSYFMGLEETKAILPSISCGVCCASASASSSDLPLWTRREVLAAEGLTSPSKWWPRLSSITEPLQSSSSPLWPYWLMKSGTPLPTLCPWSVPGFVSRLCHTCVLPMTTLHGKDYFMQLPSEDHESRKDDLIRSKRSNPQGHLG